MEVSLYDHGGTFTLTIKLATPEDVADVLHEIIDTRIGNRPKLNHFRRHPEGVAVELSYEIEEYAREAAEKAREIADSGEQEEAMQKLTDQAQDLGLGY